MIIALAALMWFLYLVPTWFKRQEYLATERNAVRLQQTMRILAESAEMPSVVRVEATARTVAAQQRALRQQQRQSGSRGAFSLPAQAQRTVDSGARTRRRLRRSRALASLVLVVSFIGAAFGVSAAVSGNWLVLAVSVAAGAGSVTLLAQAATVTRARAELRKVSMASVTPTALHDDADFVPQREAGWTPVPVPKPLYLSSPAPAARPALAHVAAQQVSALTRAEFDHAAELRTASAHAESALRAAQTAPEVARISRPAPEAPAAPPSRFASMGVIDPAGTGATDLDEILRRRRAVG